MAKACLSITCSLNLYTSMLGLHIIKYVLSLFSLLAGNPGHGMHRPDPRNHCAHPPYSLPIRRPIQGEQKHRPLLTRLRHSSR